MDSASLRAFDEISAAAGQAMFPGTVTIGGTSYACSLTRPRQGSILGNFGDEPEAVVLTVRILKTVLPTAPAINIPLTWDGSAWKIRTVRGQEASEAKWTLTCDPNP